jgi:alanine racemase
MTISRRTFVAAATATALTRPAWAAPLAPAPSKPGDRFDPWLEVDAAALRENVGVISRLVGRRPILAVIKNNGYGLGLTNVAALLEPLPEIVGFAVVKTAAAIALRDAGIRKPVLLMGLFTDESPATYISRCVARTRPSESHGRPLKRRSLCTPTCTSIPA